jgi:hypothetical protein
MDLAARPSLKLALPEPAEPEPILPETA